MVLYQETAFYSAVFLYEKVWPMNKMCNGSSRKENRLFYKVFYVSFDIFNCIYRVLLEYSREVLMAIVMPAIL